MLFRLESVPFHRGAKPLATFKWIDVLAVIPASVERETLSIRNLLLCRTDAGLQRLDERLLWEAIEKGQYRESRRQAAIKG